MNHRAAVVHLALPHKVHNFARRCIAILDHGVLADHASVVHVARSVHLGKPIFAQQRNRCLLRQTVRKLVQFALCPLGIEQSIKQRSPWSRRLFVDCYAIVEVGHHLARRRSRAGSLPELLDSGLVPFSLSLELDDIGVILVDAGHLWAQHGSCITCRPVSNRRLGNVGCNLRFDSRPCLGHFDSAGLMNLPLLPRLLAQRQNLAVQHQVIGMYPSGNRGHRDDGKADGSVDYIHHFDKSW
mmetsp:Transcript_35364/g.92505  ORF Transcript_35364/g.92505 Transcript_35364/m.92505 type:complete len:241 (-) Transcript_35364:11-733(-)